MISVHCIESSTAEMAFSVRRSLYRDNFRLLQGAISSSEMFATPYTARGARGGGGGARGERGEGEGQMTGRVGVVMTARRGEARERLVGTIAGGCG